jgi:hypothetical protein
VKGGAAVGQCTVSRVRPGALVPVNGCMRSAAWRSRTCAEYRSTGQQAKSGIIVVQTVLSRRLGQTHHNHHNQHNQHNRHNRHNQYSPLYRTPRARIIPRELAEKTARTPPLNTLPTALRHFSVEKHHSIPFPGRYILTQILAHSCLRDSYTPYGIAMPSLFHGMLPATVAFLSQPLVWYTLKHRANSCARHSAGPVPDM